jgi:hypothetical protein
MCGSLFQKIFFEDLSVILAAFRGEARCCAAKVWGFTPVDIIATSFFASLALVLKEAWYFYCTLFLYLSI